MSQAVRPAEYPEIHADASLAPRDRTGPVEAPRGGDVEPPSRATRELRYLALVLGFGVLVLPLLVYLAGALTLGPYEGGLAAFLGNLYRDLASLAPGAWLLLAGPYALFWILRLGTRPFRRRRAP